MEPVYYNNEEYQEILQYLEKLTAEAEQLPYPNAKELVFSILQYFDLVHREALARLMQNIENSHPELRVKLEEDFATKTLFQLYDLIEGEIGNKPKNNNGLMGFVPVEEVGLLTPITETQWFEAGKASEIEESKLYTRNLNNNNVLITKVGHTFYAIKNACVNTALPLDQGYLEAFYLICPWHGCRYDLETGALLDRIGEKIETYEVQVDEAGMLKVGITNVIKV